MDEKLKSKNMQKGGGGGDKFSSPQVARGHWPPDQNPADAREYSIITVLRVLLRDKNESQAIK